MSLRLCGLRLKQLKMARVLLLTQENCGAAELNVACFLIALLASCGLWDPIYLFKIILKLFDTTQVVSNLRYS